MNHGTSTCMCATLRRGFRGERTAVQAMCPTQRVRSPTPLKLLSLNEPRTGRAKCSKLRASDAWALARPLLYAGLVAHVALQRALGKNENVQRITFYLARSSVAVWVIRNS